MNSEQDTKVHRGLLPFSRGYLAGNETIFC